MDYFQYHNDADNEADEDVVNVTQRQFIDDSAADDQPVDQQGSDLDADEGSTAGDTPGQELGAGVDVSDGGESVDSADVSSEVEQQDALRLRRGTRVRRPPDTFQAQMIASDASPSGNKPEWLQRFEYLWSSFPDQRQDIYESLLEDCRLK